MSSQVSQALWNVQRARANCLARMRRRPVSLARGGGQGWHGGKEHKASGGLAGH